MFDDRTLAEREGDGAIVALFRKWKQQIETFGDSDNYDEASKGLSRTEEAIAAMPAAGITGFAVKLAIQINYDGIAEFERDDLTSLFWRSLFDDAARLVPELADFVEWLRAQKP